MTRQVVPLHAPAAPAPDCELPTLSTEDAEKFWTEGEDARGCQSAQVETFLKAPGLTCCVGVDMPERGHVHSHDCPAVDRGAAETSPDPAHDFRTECERLLCPLLFAARDSAQAQIVPGRRSRPAWCTECRGCDEVTPNLIAHKSTCKTGRVLSILAALAGALASNLNRKEAATEGRTGRVGDGIRPLDSLPVRTTDPTWRLQRFDSLDEIALYDDDGTLICRLSPISGFNIAWAERIVELVNAAAGMAVGQ
jgi:hypothetical protein